MVEKDWSKQIKAPKINLQRAVFLNDSIDEPLIARVTPELLMLRAKSAEPITLFIDSRGGSAQYLDGLLDLLHAPFPGQHNCPVITAVINQAGSGAAILLVTGDYAVAYPHANIHFHGVRVAEARNITVEEARRFTFELHQINREKAIDLSRHFIRRLLNRYADYLPQANGRTERAKIDFFFSTYLTEKVSDQTRTILEDTAEKAHSFLGIMRRSLDIVSTTSPEIRNSMQIQSVILQEVVRHHIANHTSPEDDINEEMLNQIVANYVKIREYQRGNFDHYLEELTGMAYTTFLDDQINTEFALQFGQAPRQSEPLTKEQLKWLFPHVFFGKFGPFLVYTLFLCQRLQQSENSLNARDAYWLGAIDEVLTPNYLPTEGLNYASSLSNNND